MRANGVSRATMSSATSRSSASAPGGATGTARTTCSAPWSRATWHAARAVEPVAMPSSMMIAVFPASATRGRSPRKRWTRRSSSTSSREVTLASSASVTRAAWTTSLLTIRTPPSPIAPMASSRCDGTPNLRTMMTSSGASSAAATSKATGTPPLGRPSTTLSPPRRCSNLCASLRPASARFVNGIVYRPARAVRSERVRLDADKLARRTSEYADGELTVGQRGFDGSPVTVGYLDLALVAAVLPLVRHVLPRRRTPKTGPKPEGARPQFDRDVLGRHGGVRGGKHDRRHAFGLPLPLALLTPPGLPFPLVPRH